MVNCGADKLELLESDQKARTSVVSVWNGMDYDDDRRTETSGQTHRLRVLVLVLVVSRFPFRFVFRCYAPTQLPCRSCCMSTIWRGYKWTVLFWGQQFRRLECLSTEQINFVYYPMTEKLWTRTVLAHTELCLLLSVSSLLSSEQASPLFICLIVLPSSSSSS